MRCVVHLTLNKAFTLKNILQTIVVCTAIEKMPKTSPSVTEACCSVSYNDGAKSLGLASGRGVSSAAA